MTKKFQWLKIRYPKPINVSYQEGTAQRFLEELIIAHICKINYQNSIKQCKRSSRGLLNPVRIVLKI